MPKKPPEGCPESSKDTPEKQLSPEAVAHYAQPLGGHCAWLSIVIICAAYNLQKIDHMPRQIACLGLNCDAVITTIPRKGSEHLLEPAIEKGDPSCDKRASGKNKIQRAFLSPIEAPSAPLAPQEGQNQQDIAQPEQQIQQEAPHE